MGAGHPDSPGLHTTPEQQQAQIHRLRAMRETVQEYSRAPMNAEMNAELRALYAALQDLPVGAGAPSRASGGGSGGSNENRHNAKEH